MGERTIERQKENPHNHLRHCKERKVEEGYVALLINVVAFSPEQQHFYFFNTYGDVRRRVPL